MSLQETIYAASPVWLQNALCCIKGYQLTNIRYRGGYFKYYKQLKASERASAEEIRAYKEEHIFRMLEYAYEHCPFYHTKYKEAGLTPSDFKQLDDLRKFPKLTKEEVRRYWMGMLSDEAQPKDLVHRHTSGSTGTALDIYLSRDNLQQYWAGVWRGRHRCGIGKGDLHLNFMGKLVVPLSQQHPPYWRYNRSINQYMLNMQHITPTKIADIVRFINSHDFRFFVGYPSIVNTLAQMTEEAELTIDRVPPYMFLSSEKLYDWQREQIERVFPGTRILEHYGFAENAGSASKCICGHYHEDWELGHFEIDDPKQTTDYEFMGRLLATGFHNFAMPFIRYEVGDTVTFSSRSCTCGMHSQVITDIDGRNDDYVLTPEGTRIMRWDHIFKDTSDIKEGQVVQCKAGEITLRIVRRDGYSSKTERQLVEFIHSRMSATLKVNFEYVDNIPRTQTGKFRGVVSELNKPLSRT